MTVAGQVLVVTDGRLAAYLYPVLARALADPRRSQHVLPPGLDAAITDFERAAALAPVRPLAERGQAPVTLVTVKEAATALGVTERTMRRYCERGKVRAHRLGRAWYIDRTAVRDAAKSGLNIRKISNEHSSTHDRGSESRYR